MKTAVSCVTYNADHMYNCEFSNTCTEKKGKVKPIK